MALKGGYCGVTCYCSLKKKQERKTKRTDGSGCSRVQGLGFGFRISVRVGLRLSRLTGLGGGMGNGW